MAHLGSPHGRSGRLRRARAAVRTPLGTLEAMPVRFVILGGGPAGNTAATVAATLGAEVTLVERDIVGGAAHLWDCIPSKAMIATGGQLSELTRARVMGLRAEGSLDGDALRERVASIEGRLHESVRSLLESQGVRMIAGTGRLVGAYTVAVDTADGTEEIDADAILIATGSRPRLPDWVAPDGERILTTRQAYPPPEIPDHLVVVGSGVTGVEFTHMFSALGSQVTLIVSRQQVLPTKDPEVAAVLEEEFLSRGVKLLKGRARSRSTATARRCSCSATTVAAPTARTRCSASARSPTATASVAMRPVCMSTTAATFPAIATARPMFPTSTARATCRAGCRSRRSPRCRVARSPST